MNISTRLSKFKIPKHLKKYPNMQFQKNQIINVEYRVKKMPNFENWAGKPLWLNLTKRRIPAKIESAM